MIKKLLILFAIIFYQSFSIANTSTTDNVHFNDVESYVDFLERRDATDLGAKSNKEINEIRKLIQYNDTLTKSAKEGIYFELELSRRNQNFKALNKISENDLAAMFANGKDSFNAISELAKYCCYIIGLFFVVNSIVLFMKSAGDSRQDKGGLAQPLIYFFVGCSLFAFPSSLSIIQETLALSSGGAGEILNPSKPKIGIEGIKLGVFAFLKMVGIIAVIRGWLFLIDYANGKKDGVISRGLVHLGGGACLIHMNATVTVLVNTFAPQLKIYMQ